MNLTQLDDLDMHSAAELRAAGRARRAEVWARETKDPAAMERRLDAADRSDESGYVRDRARLVPPAEGSAAARDPRNPIVAPRLALQQLQERLASLDAAGRAAPACGRKDTAFPTHLQVRFEPMVEGQAPRGCVPMARVRTDLFDARRASTAVQVLTVWTRGSNCFVAWNSPSTPGAFAEPCPSKVSLVKEMDWAAVRRAIGWSTP